MVPLPIVTGEKAPMLRLKTKKVVRVTKEVTKLIADMEDTLLHADGLGIAAPQIGTDLSICLARIGSRTMPLINPKITWQSHETDIMEEGCLSLPGIQVTITRPTNIIVQYTDIKGRTQERSLSNLDARVIQHEIDHLNGILIVDYLAPVNKRTVTKKI